jgi:regulator of replication initiation timing
LRPLKDNISTLKKKNTLKIYHSFQMYRENQILRIKNEHMQKLLYTRICSEKKTWTKTKQKNMAISWKCYRREKYHYTPTKIKCLS